MASSTGGGPLPRRPVPVPLSPQSTSSPASRHLYLRSLDRLPNELLLPIAGALVPLPTLTTRFALRPTGTWEFRDASHQWADWLSAHRNLLAFAQTSQRMASVAKPFLYHNLVIPNARSLVTLYHRLHTRPEIRPWIRDITCLVNVAGSQTIFDVYQAWLAQGGPDTWGAPHLTPDSAIALELLKRILLHAPNLRNFLVAFPDHDLVASEPGRADVSLRLYKQSILDHLTNPEQPWSWIDLPVFFPFERMRNLTSLRIYCHREDGARDLTLSRLLADYAVAILPQLTQLRTLELCGSSANNFVNEKEIALPPLPQIEHLRFYGSQIHEPRLVAFCLACTNLQTLVVHFEASSPDEDRDLLPEGKALSDALAGLAGSLRTLELVALSEGHYLTRGRERPRKPENHRLRCIPDLQKLQTLTLDYRGVFGTLGILEMEDGERLCQLLPPSLQDFTLVCEWGTASDWRQSYMANLDMVLYGVEALCDGRSSNLRSISLAIHSWPAEGKFHRRFRREVETARQRCLRAGILFRTFDLLPSYTDEDEPEPVPEEGEEDDEEGEWIEDESLAAASTGSVIPHDEETEYELEEEDEASEYYFSGDEDTDEERAARRPPTFAAFLEQLGENHGHSFEDLFYAYHEDRWDQYLF
ncbi:hypothetical protein QBC35DRAFT_384283 [Podospora australis]|uniref:F-box domain-containing protein n=1 Tax=Podospora australis TaxID=1536484 RepID=A0AAN6WT76_9PEZI|nr:hypothetical protein QBC35DRAFT_384283 [Podospora australis]